MADAGLLRPEERLVLLEGEIITMTPQKSPHAAAIGKTERALERLFGPGCWARVQMPLVFDPDSEPEPDLAVVAGDPADYVEQHPRTAWLVVEVADTTLLLDRERKLRVYAGAGIPEYWIVNLVDRSLEVYRDPISLGDRPPHYQTRNTFSPSESVSPLTRPAASALVSELLP